MKETFFTGRSGFLWVPCSRPPPLRCAQSEAVPSQDCGRVPKDKSRQTAAYSWKERMRRAGPGWTAAGADCGTGLMSGRLHPSLRLYGTAVQAMGNVYDLEQFWRKGCLGHKLPGRLTLHDLAPGFLGSSVLDLLALHHMDRGGARELY